MTPSSEVSSGAAPGLTSSPCEPAVCLTVSILKMMWDQTNLKTVSDKVPKPRKWRELGAVDQGSVRAAKDRRRRRREATEEKKRGIKLSNQTSAEWGISRGFIKTCNKWRTNRQKSTEQLIIFFMFCGKKESTGLKVWHRQWNRPREALRLNQEGDERRLTRVWLE